MPASGAGRRAPIGRSVRGRVLNWTDVPAPSLGDHVRILQDPTTAEGGWAGREGTCYGFTTPSLTGVEVVGHTEDDDALNVGFDDGETAWFAPHLVEFIDHAPGTTITVGDKPMVRDADGNWRPDEQG